MVRKALPLAVQSTDYQRDNDQERADCRQTAENDADPGVDGAFNNRIGIAFHQSNDAQHERQ